MFAVDSALKAAVSCALAGHRVMAAGAGGLAKHPSQPIRWPRWTVASPSRPSRKGVAHSPGARPYAELRSKTAMRIYALVSSRISRQTLDLFVTREAAEAELREILEDEPGWVNVLRVLAIELDGRNLSAN